MSLLSHEIRGKEQGLCSQSELGLQPRFATHFLLGKMGMATTSPSKGGLVDTKPLAQLSVLCLLGLVGLPPLSGECWGLARRAVEGHLPWALITFLSPAFSQVLENTAFFGDVVLRFPRIVHHYFDHNSNWNLLIRWGISFCNQSGVFDQGPHSPILSLVRTGAGTVRSPVSQCPVSLAAACSWA